MFKNHQNGTSDVTGFGIVSPTPLDARVTSLRADRPSSLRQQRDGLQVRLARPLRLAQP